MGALGRRLANEVYQKARRYGTTCRFTDPSVTSYDPVADVVAAATRPASFTVKGFFGAARHQSIAGMLETIMKGVPDVRSNEYSFLIPAKSRPQVGFRAEIAARQYAVGDVQPAVADDVTVCYLVNLVSA